MKKQIIKSGIGVKDIQNKDAVAKLVKAALPHHEAHIDTFDDAAYHYPLDGRKQRRQESFLIAPPVSPRATFITQPSKGVRSF